MDSACQKDGMINNYVEHKVRIEWVDVFKAVCIIVMVLGHTWGGFNQYIYQFHMAAFFFISGFTSNIWKHDLEKLAFKKIHTLIIPLLTMIVLISPITHIIGDGISLPDSIVMIKQDLFNIIAWNGVVNLLGAAWFILCLFWIFIIHRILYSFSTKCGGLWVYLGLTIMIFILGYHLFSLGFRSFRQEDITLIAQYYFGVGVFVRQKIFKSRQYTTRSLFIMLIIATAIMIITGNWSVQTVMDFPSRSYPSIVIMAILPFDAFVMIYAFSALVCRYTTKIKEFLLVVGRETLGILFLHFLMFKFATIILIIIGKASFEDLKIFLPVSIVGNNPLLIILYVVTAVCASTVIWKSLCGVPYLRWLLGKEEARS